MFPWTDWQFWVVTALALAALYYLARPFLPARGKSKACRGCRADHAAPARPDED